MSGHTFHPLYSKNFKHCWNYFFHVAVCNYCLWKEHSDFKGVDSSLSLKLLTVWWSVLEILQDFWRQLSGKITSDLLGHVCWLLHFCHCVCQCPYKVEWPLVGVPASKQSTALQPTKRHQDLAAAVHGSRPGMLFLGTISCQVIITNSTRWSVLLSLLATLK